MEYPSWRYHPTEEARIVHSAEEEEALGSGWADSPAAHGIETAPGAEPDLEIAARRPKSVETSLDAADTSVRATKSKRRQ
jgi:hypothetical protein